MKPTDEQVKEFWERCGLRYEIDEDCYKVILPDGDWYNFGHDTDINPTWENIEPPIDLNNLFKYAVPKLIDMNIVLRLGCSGDKDNLHWWASLLKHREGEPYNFKDWYKSNSGETLALALFWAIKQAVEVSE